MTEYKFDLDKLTVWDLAIMADPETNLKEMVAIMEKSGIEGLRELPFAEFPKIFAAFQIEVAKRAADLAIALGSFLWNDEDEEGS